MKLSVMMPARDEAAGIAATLRALAVALDAAGIDFEVVVVDNGSRDGTADVVRAVGAEDPRVLLVEGASEGGFGRAVRTGLESATGDGVAIVMADGSDDPRDLVAYQRKLEDGWDCVFGSRFRGGRRVDGYPIGKLVLNRVGNQLIRLVFRHGLDDTTNAFKAYRREVLEGVAPLRSEGFELTVELSLRAIARGYRHVVIPISWHGRRTGRSKFRLRTGGRYLEVLWRELRAA